MNVLNEYFRLFLQGPFQKYAVAGWGRKINAYARHIVFPGRRILAGDYLQRLGAGTQFI